MREAPIGIGQHEALAIAVSHEARSVESDAVRCISEAVTKLHPGVRVVPPDEFRRTAFPDLSSEASVYSSEYLALLVQNPTFRERIAPLGIRYIISVSGVTEQSLAGGFGIDVGLIAWDRHTQLKASVLDLAKAPQAGELQASASGTTWRGHLVGVPLAGGSTSTESVACEQLGDAVVRFFADRTVAKP